jgi:teichuronic acid biosynthesis glycosyltransferase TuaG
VQNQEYENWEHLLIDDQSDDESFSILKEWSNKDNRYKVFRNQENCGSGVSRNYAIKKSQGKYIAFLDSDDIWHKEKLSRQINFMQDTQAVFSHTSYGYINAKGEKIKDTFHVSPHPVTYTDLLKRTEISCLTAIFDAEQIGKFYMTEHRRKQDYALWLSILKAGYRSYGLDEELAYYRQHNSSATSNKFSLIGKHVHFLMETQEMSLFKALYYTTFWIVNGTKRYYLK